MSSAVIGAALHEPARPTIIAQIREKWL